MAKSEITGTTITHTYADGSVSTYQVKESGIDSDGKNTVVLMQDEDVIIIYPESWPNIETAIEDLFREFRKREDEES